MTNRELFAHYAFLKTLLENADISVVKSVVDEIYHSLGGGKNEKDDIEEEERNKS